MKMHTEGDDCCLVTKPLDCHKLCYSNSLFYLKSHFDKGMGKLLNTIMGQIR